MFQKGQLTGYSNVLIQADLDFLKYQIKNQGVKLIAGTGLHKLISECEHFLAIPSGEEFTYDVLKPLLVLYSLSDTVRTLWMKGKKYATQLGAMNSGDFSYGVKGSSHDKYFKDFEFELFSAAFLVENNVDVELPQHTEGNDIMFGQLEIQCKHPEVLSRDNMDDYLRAFQSSLVKSNKYGVFGVGSDDFLGFTPEQFGFDDKLILANYQRTLQVEDDVLRHIFDDVLRFCPRVLGVYILNTHFLFSEKMGLTLSKTSNAVFCLRPNAKEVPESMHREAYKILYPFNSKPAIRSY